MAQKGAGGNPGAITKKGGVGASGSTGTGRGGGNTGSRLAATSKTYKKNSEDGGANSAGSESDRANANE
ncbi:MAG: hypothetical protein ACSLE1_16210 [Sphingobium sp.]